MIFHEIAGKDDIGIRNIGYRIARRMTAPNHEVLTGLDVMEAANFAELVGKRVGLITNHTGLSRDGKRNRAGARASGVWRAGSLRL